MDLKTQVIPGIGLQVPVFDGSYKNGKGKLLSEPETLRNTILEQMFQPEELESLLLVKVDNKNPDPKHLKPRIFDDGVKRSLAFSSGNSYYFADDDLRAKIGQLFETDKDTACRYGSLLTSSCLKGVKTFEGVRVKIVDFESKVSEERAEAKKYQTNDCRGKITPNLLRQLGGDTHRPFQFRFTQLKSWSENPEENLSSFIAKGTLLADLDGVLASEGIDIVIDRSSIKGINKKQLPELIPCGVYEFDKSVIGNRGNAKSIDYGSSWQYLMWYSEEALRKDIVPATKEAAQNLAAVQGNPMALNKLIVDEHDKQLARRQQHQELSDDNQSLNDSDDKKQESKQEELRLVKLLRNDKYCLMDKSPFVAEAKENWTKNKWCELAINGVLDLSSGMAQPAEDLKRGQVCVPHLPKGDVILTRYPIVSSDNVRVYQNIHRVDLMRYKGVAFINPQDFKDYHQGDFDGDQAVVSEAKKTPNIAKETLRAGDPPRYAPVKQRNKVSYLEIEDENGERKHKTLSSIAAASSQNKIGVIAVAIGRVATSLPAEDENVKLFERRKIKLLDRLFDALQVEVDSPKSALRHEDIDEIKGDRLLKDVENWAEVHPSRLFDFKSDERLYKTFPLPADEPNAINVIAREAVNPYWEPVRIRHRERHEFRYIFAQDEVYPADEDYARELKQRATDAISDIKKRVGDDRKAFSEEIGKFYDSLRIEINEVLPAPEDRFAVAMALGHILHTRPDLSNHQKESAEIAENLSIAFALETEYQFIHEALPKEAYVLQVPFKKTEKGTELIVSERFADKLEEAGIPYEKKGNKKEGKRLIVSEQEADALDELGIKYKEQPKMVELVSVWKDRLDSKGINYEAIAHPELPLVEFAFKDLSHTNAKVLQEKYGNNYNDPFEIDIPNNLMIVPPPGCGWIESRDEPGKAKLVFNLFMDEVVEAIKQVEIEDILVLGVGRNDYANEDFSSRKWRNKEVTVEVGAIDRLSPTHPDYYRLNGAPILKIDGKDLGTFAGNGPLLPIGTKMTATLEPEGNNIILHIDPKSLQLPEVKDEINEPKNGIHNSQSDNAADTNIKPRRNLQEDMQEILVTTIKKHYEATSSDRFSLNGTWTVYAETDGDFSVRNESNRTVCRGNYQTGEILKDLTEEAAEQLQEIMDEDDREAPPNRREFKRTQPIKKSKQLQP